MNRFGFAPFARRRTLLLSTVVMAGFSCAWSPAAIAQQAAPAALPQQDSGGLDRIVVTAQYIEEDLQSAALAVDVVTGEDLTIAGITSSADLNRLVPSLSIAQGGGPLTSYFVRGVGNFTNNGFSDPAIAFNLDGVYLGRPTSTVGTFYDLSRIEVLKGPQGTLYGRNATAGAINVIPNAPRIGEFSGAASASFANFGSINVQGALNVPLGDTMALRVAGNVVDREGYNDDGTSDEVGEAARAQLLIEPSDTVTIKLSADYSHQGGFGPGATLSGRFISTPAAPRTSVAPAGYVFDASGLSIDSGLLAPASVAEFGSYVVAGVNPARFGTPYLDNAYWGVHAEASVETPWGDLLVLPAYREASLDFLFNGPTFRAGQTRQEDQQTSLEARFQGRQVGIFDWLVGAYYFDETVDGLNGFNQYGVIAFQDFTSTTESTAYFARVTANLTDEFRLVAGARQTKDDKSMSAVGLNIIQICTAGPPNFCTVNGSTLPLGLTAADLGIPLPAAPGAPNSIQFGGNANSRIFTAPLTIAASPSFEKPTYRLAAEWDVTPDSLLYASYETGFRSGGFSISFGREFFQPETIKAFTIGSKNRFFDERLQINAELFHWTYEDQQVSHFGADLRGNNSFFTENIGASTIQGVDVEGQFLATESTLLTFTAQYLDSVIDEFSFRQLRTPGVSAVTGCNATAVQDRDINGVAGFEPEFVIDCSGKRGYNSPELSLDFGVQQTIDLSAGELVLSADTRFRGDRVVGFDFLPQQNSGEEWTSNASIRFSPFSGGWDVEAFVRNIEDERAPTAVQYSGSSGSTVSSSYSAPRTYGVRLGYAF